MPDHRRHRGPHQEDAKLFAPECVPALEAAVRDLSWLLSRGYAAPSSLKLVGDRFGLDQRQRIAVNRCSCSNEAFELRRERGCDAEAIRGSEVWIDGYNLLTTVEAALARGVILHGRDGCYRDMASMHGSYRKVAETIPALTLIGEVLAARGAGPVRWLLDSPVSNSGRLKTMIASLAAERGWRWSVELVASPDSVLAQCGEIIVTADSGILDRCGRWWNLARPVVSERVPEAWVVDLSARGE